MPLLWDCAAERETLRDLIQAYVRDLPIDGSGPSEQWSLANFAAGYLDMREDSRSYDTLDLAARRRAIRAFLVERFPEPSPSYSSFGRVQT